MNTLERIKKAEEAGPTAVLVIGEMPTDCSECDLCSDIDKGRNMALCRYYDSYSTMVCGRLPSCPLHKAIGIIEPGCRIRLFTENEEE